MTNNAKTVRPPVGHQRVARRRELVVVLTRVAHCRSVTRLDEKR
jgi:hypothetical protein